MSGEITETVQNEELCALSDELLDGVYFLYNQAYEEVEQSELVSYLDMDDFLLLRKYMDYEIFDFDGNALLDKEDSAKVKKLSVVIQNMHFMCLLFLMKMEIFRMCRWMEVR